MAALGKRTRVRLYERLAEAGLLRAAEGRILGLFPTHRWPAEHTGHEGAVQAGLTTALRDGETTDARTGALVSLLLALRAVHKAVAPESVGVSKAELNASAKRIAGEDCVGKAVRAAINRRMWRARTCFIPFHERFAIDVPGPDDMEIKGDLLDHEFIIERAA